MANGLGILPSYSEPTDDDLLLRQSTIESMMLCPARVGYSTHPEHDHTPSEPMFYGTVVHAVIEDHITNGESLRLHSPDYVRELMEKIAVDDEFDIGATAPEHLLQSFAQEVVEAYQAWLSQWWAMKSNFFKPLAIEERLIRPLGTLPNGRAVWVHGTPDALLQSGMTDWKTAGRGWSPGKGEVRIQTPTYLWLGEDIRGVREGIGDYVVYDRSKKTWSSFIVPVFETQIDAALQTLWEYARQIDAQVFPPTPAAPAGRPGRGWWCQPKYCGAWDLCTYKGLVADDMNLTEVRISTWS